MTFFFFVSQQSLRSPPHTSFCLRLFCNVYHTEKKNIIRACLFLIAMNSQYFLDLEFSYAIRDTYYVVDKYAAAMNE